MNDHLRRLKLSRVLSPETEKNLPLRKTKEAKVVVNREKVRKSQYFVQ